jgi:hypothetical protein
MGEVMKVKNGFWYITAFKALRRFWATTTPQKVCRRFYIVARPPKAVRYES